MATQFNVVIPTRWANTRLPQKAIADLGGKPLTNHVFEAAIKSGADNVIVAADNRDILEMTVGFYYGCMTSEDCRSGTDRVFEVAKQFKWDDEAIVVNVQGDEPFIRPESIKQVADLLSYEFADIATLYTTGKDLQNENVVKVGTEKGCQLSRAVKFSRIPWEHDCYEHMGIYAYRVKTLRAFCQFEQTQNEITNRLEQLRALDNGMEIVVDRCRTPSAFGGVDTPEDLQQARLTLERLKQLTYIPILIEENTNALHSEQEDRWCK